ncbi:putative PIF1 helicase-like protein [Trypanosoma grayi]|uniref:putative PIF1 helicase-like protein n=1 Tax=Trypanosoma grayi TaxID=71804 RepID=UPI0004F46C93|nr:putative PIF1 helicase-like protein [Trypanosoma grayi]KEG13674.1 putative PIF1 helicase-like protein [Trypanosoma grayi]
MWPCEHLLYVAMSRVRNPEQLSMSSFEPSMVVANKECVEFDRKLPAVHNLPPTDGFPVASWRRCNDTLSQLRCRGASLSNLLRGATLKDGSGTRLAGPMKGTIEHSVLVARRMRKLIKHTERIAKIRENRRKSQSATDAQSDTSSSGASVEEHIL